VAENGQKIDGPITATHHIKRVSLHHYVTKSLEVRAAVNDRADRLTGLCRCETTLPDVDAKWMSPPPYQGKAGLSKV
jgi:hypothetical protein